MVCDRYTLSSLAYQGTALPGPWVEVINARAPRPDLTLWLKVSSAVAQSRRGTRGAPEELFESAQRQRRVAAAYARLMRQKKRAHRVVAVNGNAAPSAVLSDALAALAAIGVR